MEAHLPRTGVDFRKINYLKNVRAAVSDKPNCTHLIRLSFMAPAKFYAGAGS